jgi:hypothetical protein
MLADRKGLIFKGCECFRGGFKWKEWLKSATLDGRIQPSRGGLFPLPRCQFPGDQQFYLRQHDAHDGGRLLAGTGKESSPIAIWCCIWVNANL